MGGDGKAESFQTFYLGISIVLLSSAVGHAWYSASCVEQQVSLRPLLPKTPEHVLYMLQLLPRITICFGSFADFGLEA